MRRTSGETGARRALVIGIDHYPGLGQQAQLRGAVHDAEQMADLLEQRFGFSPPRLCLLKNDQATRRRLVAEMESLVIRSAPGDSAVLHWSGHGSQIVDPDHDEPDGLDETLVPFDGRRPGELPQDLTDDEIRHWLSRLESRGCATTLIVDCCHSGHVHRHSSLQPRGLPRALRPTPADCRPPAAPTSDAAAERPSRYALLAACREDQLAWERPVGDGEFHGHWTWAILRTLTKAATAATAGEIFELARARLLRESPEQEPVFVGQRDRLIFGCRARPTQRFLFVDSWEPENAHGELRGGAVQGLVTGSRWDLYPPARRPGQGSIGRAAIRRVGALRSTFSVEDGSLRRPPAVGDRAFERLPGYGEPRLPVAVDSSLGESDRLRTAIESSPLLRLNEGRIHDPDQLQLHVETGSSGPWIWIADLRGRPLAAPLPLDRPGATRALIERLERRARCRNVLALENHDPASALGDTLQLRPLDRVSRRPRWAYSAGENFVVEIEHHHPNDLFIALLDLGSTDRVSLLHPEDGGEDLLPPGLPLRIGHLPGDPLIAKRPDDLYPRDLNAATGHLKLFATTAPVDLAWLDTECPWRGAESGCESAPRHTLERLLARASAVTLRHGDQAQDWGATTVPLRVLPAHR